MVFAVVFVGWIASVCLHEFGHALVAYLGGDRSVREKGYLTNPFTYIHPVNSILIPVLFLLVGGIGLPGAAVLIDERRLRSRAWSVAVSLAGPAMSALSGVLIALPLRMGLVQGGGRLGAALAFLVYLEGWATVLNLMPVPPLDGFHALSKLVMSERTRRTLMGYSLWAFVVLFLVINRTPVGDVLARAVVRYTDALGVDLLEVDLGRQLFFFWSRR
jgi:Zn-dependent protease